MDEWWRWCEAESVLLLPITLPLTSHPSLAGRLQALATLPKTHSSISSHLSIDAMRLVTLPLVHSRFEALPLAELALQAASGNVLFKLTQERAVVLSKLQLRLVSVHSLLVLGRRRFTSTHNEEATTTTCILLLPLMSRRRRYVSW